MQRRRPLGRDAGVETRLWLLLRALEGFHFRRNAPFRTFRLDFVEHERRLVIELRDAAPGRDAHRSALRDRLLNEAGYAILRLNKTDVARDLSSALYRIRAVLDDLAGAD